MKKTLIASAVAAATCGAHIELSCYDFGDPKFILKDPFHGKKAKKGKAKKDWQR